MRKKRQSDEGRGKVTSVNGARDATKSAARVKQLIAPATTAQIRRMPVQDAIVAASVELFGERGYHATSVQEIVTAAGVTKGAFYHYFASKDDVLVLIHDLVVDHVWNQTRAIADREVPPDQAIELIVQAIVRSVSQHRDAVKVFFRDRDSLSGKSMEHVRAKRDRFDRWVAELIVRGETQGIFRKTEDARILSFGLIGMAAWTYQWFRPNGKHTADEVASMLSDMVLGGLRADRKLP